jgi:hypothetical protein
MLGFRRKTRHVATRGGGRRHTLTLEPLERRLLLTASLDLSSYLDANFSYATDVDDQSGSVYVQLPHTVVKLIPEGNDYRLATSADGWNAPTWSSIPVGGDIAVAGGSVYVTGQGGSSFEAHMVDGALQATSADTLRDVYIVKLDANTGAVQYATFLGGNKGDTGRGIEVDGVGNIYVAGSTGSDDSFPLLDDPNDYPDPNNVPPDALGDNEGFVAVLQPDGDGNYTLPYLELFGGSNSDLVHDIALSCHTATGPFCDVVITGSTMSPEFAGGFDGETYVKKQDIFVVKLSPTDNGSPAAAVGKIIGGKFDDVGRGVAVLGDDVYVAGTTSSSDLPMPGQNSGASDAVVIKLNSNLHLVQGRYLGGSGNDSGDDVAVGGGSVYITGGTESGDFHTISGFDAVGDDSQLGVSFGGTTDAFVAKLGLDLDDSQHFIYLGGSGADSGWGIAADGAGNSYVTGRTDSPNDFPLQNAFDGSFGVFGTGAPTSNGFVARVSYGPPNQPPDAVDDAATTDEDTSVTIDVLLNDTDPDADSLTIASVTQAANGSVTFDGDSVVYTPNADFHGGDSFTYTVSDGRGGTDTAAVSLNVVSVDDFPVAVDDAATTTEATGIVISVLANDYLGDEPTLIEGVTQGANGLVDIDGSSTIYLPNHGFVGADHYYYTITDSDGDTDTAMVTVTVNAVPTAETYVQDEIPDLAIPDLGMVTSTLTVTDSFTIASLTVVVDISHARPSDLTLYLIHGSTRIALPSVTGGTVSAFNGEDVNGDWILEIHDNKKIKVGTLNEWQITVESG